jgi:excinuclease ABC subunit A
VRGWDRRNAHYFQLILSLARTTASTSTRRVKEIRERLTFLNDVGLNYLTLDRAGRHAVRRRSQRIRLASQIGSGLTGVLYVLDEPSIGLHQRDNARLLGTLKRLRDLGNTVIVVEHDEDAIRCRRPRVDIGPGAGVHGGEIVAQGTPPTSWPIPRSLTGQYLSGARGSRCRARAAEADRRWLKVVGARGNNLKNVSAAIPLGTVHLRHRRVRARQVDADHRHALQGLARKLNGASEGAARARSHRGLEHVRQGHRHRPVADRPHAALESGDLYRRLFTPIRDWFAGLPEAKARGYKPGAFQLQRQGRPLRGLPGRRRDQDRDALPARRLRHLRRLQGQALQPRDAGVLFKGKSIADVLDMTVEEAPKLFKERAARCATSWRRCARRPRLHQARPAGDDAVRRRGAARQAAKELSKRATGRTLYILDEPTTGLHFHDVKKLLEVLHELVDQGNTVVVIEHNLDVIKTADWVIDLGPEGGDGGGELHRQLSLHAARQQLMTIAHRIVDAATAAGFIATATWSWSGWTRPPASPYRCLPNRAGANRPHRAACNKPK